MAKKIELRYITDPGHGWAEVPATLAFAVGVGTDFVSRGAMLYLEEDCEMADLERAMKRHGYIPKFVEMYVDDFDAWLDGTEWPNIPKGGEAMAEEFWNVGPEIDGIPGKVGDMVFWVGNSRVPWWIAEWQPQNGQCFAIINAMGDVGTAAPADLSRNFRDAHTTGGE